MSESLHDGLGRQEVGLGEIRVLLPLFGYGNAAHAHVELAGLHAGQHGIEIHLFKHRLDPQLFSDELYNVHLDAHDLPAGKGFKGREIRAGGDGDLSLLLHVLQTHAVAAAGEQGANQRDCQREGSKFRKFLHLFHAFPFFSLTLACTFTGKPNRVMKP